MTVVFAMTSQRVLTDKTRCDAHNRSFAESQPSDSVEAYRALRYCLEYYTVYKNNIQDLVGTGMIIAVKSRTTG